MPAAECHARQRHTLLGGIKPHAGDWTVTAALRVTAESWRLPLTYIRDAEFVTSAHRPECLSTDKNRGDFTLAALGLFDGLFAIHVAGGNG
jgi:hypothetical protein